MSGFCLCLKDCKRNGDSLTYWLHSIIRNYGLAVRANAVFEYLLNAIDNYLEFIEFRDESGREREED